MDPFKIAVKLFATGPLPPLHAFIPVFHAWIREQNTSGSCAALPNHLLIDVADYAHVQDGPGIVLVTAEANLYIDENGGRPGLLYVRKTPAVGEFGDRLRQAVEATMAAATALEKEPLDPAVHLDREKVQVRLNDRLLTPNTAETFDALRPAFEDVFRGQLVRAHSLDRPRELMTVAVG